MPASIGLTKAWPRAAWTMTAGLALTTLAGGCNKGTTSGTTGTTNGGGDAAASLSGGAVAGVNGQEIDREDFHRFLEVAAGERALPQLIDYEIVMQELKKQNQTVDDAEVKTALDKLAEQRKKRGGPDAAQFDVLFKSEAGKAALERNIRQDLAINAIMTKGIKADEAAMKTWFDKNHARYDTPAQVKVGLLLATTKVRADLMARQLTTKTKTFAQLVAEQKKVNDPLASQGSIEESPTAVPLSMLGPQMGALAPKMKVGDNTAVLALGSVPVDPSSPTSKKQPVFGIMRLASRVDAKKADLTAMKSQIATDYKLTQVAQRVVKENPQNPPFDKTLKDTETFISQQLAQAGETSKPAYRDVLNYILSGEKQKTMSLLRAQAKVTVPDAIFGSAAKTYGPQAAVPGAMGMPGGMQAMPQGAMPQGAMPSGAAPSGPMPSGPASGAPSGAR